MKKKMKKRTKESVKDPKCLEALGPVTRMSIVSRVGCGKKHKVYYFDKGSWRCKSFRVCRSSRSDNNVYFTRQECQTTCLKPSDPIFEQNTKI